MPSGRRRATVMVMFSIAWLRDTGERVVRSALAAVIAAVVLNGAFDLTAWKTLIFVGITAGLTVVKAAVAAVIPVGPPAGLVGTWSWLVDALERLVTTWVEAFVAALLTNGSYDLSTLRTAAIAGCAAVVSLLVSVLALPTINTISPASLVKATPRQAARRVPRRERKV